MTKAEIPTLKAMMLNIFKDLANLSTSISKETATKELIKATYQKRKAYVSRYVKDEAMGRYLNGWYKAYFGYIARLLEVTDPKTLTEFYKSMYVLVDECLVAKTLDYDEMTNMGAKASAGFKIASQFEIDSFPYNWFDTMTSYAFDELCHIEGKKSA